MQRDKELGLRGFYLKIKKIAAPEGGLLRESTYGHAVEVLCLFSRRVSNQAAKPIAMMIHGRTTQNSRWSIRKPWT